MTNADPEVLLHPVRIKILTALAEREATPQEIAAAGDIPKASLYRHLNILRAVGAIREVREYRVRGTFEKVYALVTDSGPLAGLGASGTIAERLRRMIRPDAPAGERPAGLWRRTVLLTDAEAAELQAVIDGWLRGRGGAGHLTVEIAVARRPATHRPEGERGNQVALAGTAFRIVRPDVGRTNHDRGGEPDEELS